MLCRKVQVQESWLLSFWDPDHFLSSGSYPLCSFVCASAFCFHLCSFVCASAFCVHLCSFVCASALCVHLFAQLPFVFICVHLFAQVPLPKLTEAETAAKQNAVRQKWREASYQAPQKLRRQRSYKSPLSSCCSWLCGCGCQCRCPAQTAACEKDRALSCGCKEFLGEQNCVWENKSVWS